MEKTQRDIITNTALQLGSKYNVLGVREFLGVKYVDILFTTKSGQKINCTFENNTELFAGSFLYTNSNDGVATDHDFKKTLEFLRLNS